MGGWRREAGRVMGEIRGRGGVPVVVGGTHYYTQSLLFGDSLVKEEKEDVGEEEAEGTFPILEGRTEEMLESLREVDGVMAERWHPNDRRKIRRSLEIFLTTGRKASDIYAEQKLRKFENKDDGAGGEGFADSPVANGSTLLFWVHSESETLKRRLDSRIDKMMTLGLLDEVQSINEFLCSQKEAGVDVDLTRGIWASIGWKEFEPYLTALKSGTASEEELNKLYELSTEQMKASTRQYAKRQVRWIRIKLLSALSDANALDKLYLLDSSRVAQFDSDVSTPAIDITAKFLNGDDLPAPKELSEVAKQLLKPDGTRNTGFRQECEMCNVTEVIEEQWMRHLKSRRHRAAENRRAKNQANGRSRGNAENGTGTEVT